MKNSWSLTLYASKKRRRQLLLVSKPEESRQRLRPLARKKLSLRKRWLNPSARLPNNKLSLREFAVRKLKMLCNVRRSPMRKKKTSRELLRP